MNHERIFALDFLKFVAAIMITNSHFIPIWKDVNIAYATLGVHGNALFFFVAGFLLMMGMENRNGNYTNWIKKRLRRLWPAVFIWAIITAIVFKDELSWQKVLFAPNYWFIQAIVIYYFIFYYIGHLFLKTNWNIRVSIYCICILFSIIYAIYMPLGIGSIFHTEWHYICHLSIMLLGALTYLSNTETENHFFSKLLVCNAHHKTDWIFCLVSFILYFLILSFGKNATNWRWYTQIVSLLPLTCFCYYAYKVASQHWCESVFSKKTGTIISFIAGLTLEIYIVQFHIITDQFNFLFPLNLFIVFFLVCITAYILRVFVNMFLQFLSKEEWHWKSCFIIK